MKWATREWWHRFGFHWWLEDEVIPEGKRTPVDIRWCPMCHRLERRERNYNPSTGHYYSWVTVTDTMSPAAKRYLRKAS